MAVCAVLLPGALDPGGPDRLSDAARDVTEPPGCVAIDVSDELAALPFVWRGRVARTWPEGNVYFFRFEIVEKGEKSKEKKMLKEFH